MTVAKSTVVAVVGLGYVGLPLAIEFGKVYRTLGYDLSESKIRNYKNGIDPTGSVTADDFKSAAKLSFSTDPSILREADVIIIAVPTPVDEARIPDLRPLTQSSIVVGQNMKKGAVIVYESTVYPGATEEVCIPLLEKHSGLAWKNGFNVGYSPERVNPGDRERSITKIVKVVSGDCETTLATVADLYGSIITAGVYPAQSIKVAEAAKVIENTQRDLNIALMNELAIVFDRMDIDTQEVLEAAKTKWNFLPFRPGLVGGHCIGVDPYYLTHKAEMLGYHPQVILAGRRINDGMAAYLAQQTIKQMIHNGVSIKGSKVAVLGLTFKENCPDIRNSKVADLVRELADYGCEVIVNDPIASHEESQEEYGIALTSWDELPSADVMVAAVSHQDYLDMPLEKLLEKLKPGGVFIDVKASHPAEAMSKAGFHVWRL